MSAATGDRFRHEALLYGSWADFVNGTVPFIRQGLAAGEPVLVVESLEKIGLLRTALEDDAERVMFADMAGVGANPARIIPAWREFVASHGGGGRRLRGIGEPIWRGRSEDELVECQRHESLLNVAFDSGQPWHLLCPYDTANLASAVIDEARRSHEFVTEGGKTALSTEYRGVDACAAPFETALEEPHDGLSTLTFDRDNLIATRAAVARFATSAGLAPTRAIELVTAVNEVATNSILHGGGQGALRMWRTGGAVVCEIRDSGVYGHPLADRERPGSGTAGSRGLWVANQLCDLVQIRTLAGATVVRLHARVNPERRLHVVDPA